MDRDVELINTLSPRRSNNVAKATRDIIEFLNNTHAISGMTLTVVKFNAGIVNYFEEHIFKYKAKAETRWNGIFNRAQVTDIIDTLMRYDFLSKLNPQSFVIVGRILLLAEECLALEQGLFRMLDTLRSKPEGDRFDLISEYGFKLHFGEGFLPVLAEYLTMPRPPRLKRWAMYILDELCHNCRPNACMLAIIKRGIPCLVSLAANTTGSQFGHDAIAQVALISTWSMVTRTLTKPELKRLSGIVWDGFNKDQLQALEALTSKDTPYIKPFTEAWFKRLIDWLYDTGCCQGTESSQTSIAWIPKVVSLNDEFIFPEHGIFILSITGEYISIYAYDIESQNPRFLDVPYDNVVSITRKIHEESSIVQIECEIEDFIESFTYLDNLDEDDAKITLSIFVKLEDADSIEEKIRDVCKNSNTPPRSSVPEGVQYVYMHNTTTETQLQKRRSEVARDMISSPLEEQRPAPVSSLGQDMISVSEASGDDRAMNNDETPVKVQEQGESGISGSDQQVAKDIITSISGIDVPDTRSSATGKLKGKLKDRMNDDTISPLIKETKKTSGKKDKLKDRQQKIIAKDVSNTKGRDEFDFECTDDEDDHEAVLVKSKGKTEATLNKECTNQMLTKSGAKKTKNDKSKATNSAESKKKTKTKTVSGVEAIKKAKNSAKRASKAAIDQITELNFYQPPEDRIKLPNELPRRSNRRAAAKEAGKRISNVVELERQDTQVLIPDQIVNRNDPDVEDQLSDHENNKSSKKLLEKPKIGRPRRQKAHKPKGDEPLQTAESTLLKLVNPRGDITEFPSREQEIETHGPRKLHSLDLLRSHNAKDSKASNQTDITIREDGVERCDLNHVSLQNQTTKKDDTSRRRYEITELGSPVSSQYHDNYAEDDAVLPASYSSGEDALPIAKSRESGPSKIELSATERTQPISAQDKQRNMFAHSPPRVAKLDYRKAAWHYGEVVQDVEGRLVQVEKQEIVDGLPSSETTARRSIVVEQVAGVSPQSVPSDKLTRPTIQGLTKPMINVCEDHIQPNLVPNHLDVRAPIQNELPDFRPMKLKPAPPGPEIVDSYLETETIHKKCEDGGPSAVNVLVKQQNAPLGREQTKDENVAQTKKELSDPTSEITHKVEVHQVLPLSTCRLWEVADDDPDQTLVPISDHDMSCVEEERSPENESPTIAKAKSMEASNEGRVTKYLPVFNVDVPSSISQAMIQIMNYHTQFLMKPQERALSMLETYQTKGEEMCKNFSEQHEKECIQSQHEVRNLAAKYEKAVKKGHQDVCDIEVKVFRDDVEAKVQEQDAQMDKLMQKAMKRYGTA